MKTRSRVVAIAVLAVILSVQTAPFALARGRHDSEDVAAKIIRVIKKVQRFIGLVPNDDSPVPPRP